MFTSISEVFGLSGNAAMALQKLRDDPERAVAEYGFVVKVPADYGDRSEGGRCTIIPSSLGGGNYELRPMVGSGRDFFFPYIHVGPLGGVGFCRVPRNEPSGTIVLTGGMNGCSLEVRKVNNKLMFLHDANGSSLAALPAADPRRAGTQLCRVDDRLYMQGQLQSNRAIVLMESLRARSEEGNVAPENYLIAVKSGDRWLVVNSAMQRVQGGPKNIRYERDPASCLITSFDD